MNVEGSYVYRTHKQSALTTIIITIVITIVTIIVIIIRVYLMIFTFMCYPSSTD